MTFVAIASLFPFTTLRGSVGRRNLRKARMRGNDAAINRSCHRADDEGLIGWMPLRTARDTVDPLDGSPSLC